MARKILERLTIICSDLAVGGALLGGIVAAAFVTSGCRSAGEPPVQHGQVQLIATAEQFNGTVLVGTMPVVVDFFAAWCPPCKALAPILDSLAGKYEGRVKFVKVDIDESQDLAGSYTVQSIPTVVVFSGGKEVHRWIGLRGADDYREVLDSILARAGKDGS